MIQYDHADAEARFLYEKAGFAAYSAYRAFELEVDERFDDAKQEAVLTFWDLHRKDNREEYAFVGAKYAAMNSLRGKSCPSRNCRSVRELIPETTCWADFTTITTGSRMKDHDMLELRNGWEYSARTGPLLCTFRVCRAPGAHHPFQLGHRVHRSPLLVRRFRNYPGTSWSRHQQHSQNPG
jgi:hypothetical protein